MVTNHRKKNSRHRGSWTHSHGEKKKHRGAGSRGGRGNAGSGKRGDAKKPRYWDDKKFHKGKLGFHNPTSNPQNAITLSQLSSSIEKFVAQGLAQKDANTFKINCSDIKVDKLLGTGTAAFAFEVVVKSASQKAIEKIEAAGGKVLIQAES
ncbi:MAG: uL15 family ribosomal protein [Nanoarchaeota archaeon]|nr:uL15 family ribosomal protein [Nanoarchaeota archaeon]